MQRAAMCPRSVECPSVKSICLSVALAVAPLASFAQLSSTKTLDIYFIDVEGGQSTLLILPEGQTLLVDAGYPGSGRLDARPGDPTKARDPQRILAVTKLAGVSRIDYLLVTHYHADHVGGVPELAQLIPIQTFVDHGPVNEVAARVTGTLTMYQAYAAVRANGGHLEPKPGEQLPLSGADTTIVSSAGATLATSLVGARSGRNSACTPAGLAAQEATENPQSLGFLLQFGEFRFLDVGDLTGAPLFRLACPSDHIGPVDVYLVAHHGGTDAADPSLFAAVTPRVAILNNGPLKGGAPETLNTLHALQGTETWQLHRSEIAGAVNCALGQIANLDDTTSNWIRIRASADGSFVVLNHRTGGIKRYPSH